MADSRHVKNDQRYLVDNRLEELQQIIGYTFKKRSLLREALTHPSMRYEMESTRAHNQRLEFLGDAVLQLVLSDMLFHRQSRWDEGGLTKLRARLVSSRALAETAKEIGLGVYVEMGTSEERSGGRQRESVLADALEAVLAAVYLDGGLDSVRVVADRLFARSIIEHSKTIYIDDGNPKGQLQELIQNIHDRLPVYKIEQESGPDHDKYYLASVTWGEHELGRGTGRTKRDAEADAARVAMQNPKLRPILHGMKL